MRIQTPREEGFRRWEQARVSSVKSSETEESEAQPVSAGDSGERSFMEPWETGGHSAPFLSGVDRAPALPRSPLAVCFMGKEWSCRLHQASRIYSKTSYSYTHLKYIAVLFQHTDISLNS